ncbi:UTP--glucose-1-phosphate uridylyltransferase [Bacillus cytotoxicus]|uniref:UTP--glucose-1-phosphate uridylyltransferase n=1 Tax=Bacillus cytotoxicus TaxID=580165 RepID=A0AAX2CHF3_9BACI|nr:MULTISPECIES: UTP--glucose-1-phosphate uridylyltransferase [Bacillus cereus group]MDH2881372.1 UTP--glucose-1-phosphate uridylyltransferase [Bacillus cytotoxicus]QTR69495.1 UTP--glucose-1-phosphate uridylyltransferase [Bacillus cytotoxicus]QTR78202.1 UTP--glucose-1-phosphate uridylyltransferase [Bacillus cytotoxicus]QTR81983.1 UTP--glucose-1-phosphate uridylyltransferase [Bacillus cytotoxicus]QTR85721.1 UTP--glucose-1-phosphate uridylyltransferase [Bacillus cytotoxicus]
MIKKAIIPAAGYGTRSLPITKVVPKEMFPIGNKPAIHYIVEEAVKSGIEQILIVVSKRKNLIVDYFDHSLELEAFLEREQKSYLLKSFVIPDIQILYTRQPYARGLGEAIKLGEAFIGNEPFAVLLPDDIIISDKGTALNQLIKIYKETKSSVIGVHTVPNEFLDKYGVVKGDMIKEGYMDITNIVEKPKINPPSNMAVIGRYVFTPDIFSLLQNVQPGVGGEYQLTDAIHSLIAIQKVYGKIIDGKRFDIGQENDYVHLLNYIHGKNRANTN